MKITRLVVKILTIFLLSYASHSLADDPLPFPSIEAGGTLSDTTIEGVTIGMSVDEAIAALESKGLKVDRRVDSTRSVGGEKIPYTTVKLVRYASEDIPQEQPSTPGEEADYMNRLNQISLANRNVSIEAPNGTLSSIYLSTNSYESVDSIKENVLQTLGTPDSESGYTDVRWNLEYSEGANRKTKGLQLDVGIKALSIQDMKTSETIPYTEIKISLVKHP